MAQELRVLLHCDKHLAEDKVKTGDAATVRVVLDGEDREVDLCPPCVKEMVDPLRDVTRAYGRRPKPAARSTPVRDDGKRPQQVGRSDTDKALYTCPVPGCAATSTDIRRHVREQHGRLAERDHLPGLANYLCPEPGCPNTAINAPCQGTNGLAVHLRKRHGILMPVSEYIAAHDLVPLADVTA